MKIINTGVADVLAIKAPPHTTGWAIGNGVIYLSSVAVKLPPGNWEPLGIELTEEQCREIIPRYNKAYPNYGNGHDGMFLTAKEAFASLMQANGCYSVNPYGEEPNHLDYKFEKFKGEFHFKSERDKNMYCDKWDQWQQAEANTGPHLILKNIL